MPRYSIPLPHPAITQDSPRRQETTLLAFLRPDGDSASSGPGSPRRVTNARLGRKVDNWSNHSETGTEAGLSGVYLEALIFHQLAIQADLQHFCVIGYHPSAQVMQQAKGVADVTTENHRPIQPGSSLRGTPRSSTTATASSPRQYVPGQVSVVRPVRAEPSWGRVLLTTVELWVSRRLRDGRLRTVRRRRLQKPALAVAAAAAVALAALQLTAAFSGAAPQAVRSSVSKHPAARVISPRPAAAAQSEAVAWITTQVSSAAIIGCYPAMCASLQAQGVSASRLVPLGSRMAGVLRTDVIATLPSADKKLVDQYAPALIASFGSGGSRIEIRTVAPGGAVAYQSALRADLSARKSAGSQLLRNPRIRFSVADATRLAAGEVDSRLLATLAALSSQFTLRVRAFGDSSPGAPLLFREVTVAKRRRRERRSQARGGAGHGQRAGKSISACALRDCPPWHRPGRAAHRVRLAEPARVAHDGPDC